MYYNVIQNEVISRQMNTKNRIISVRLEKEMYEQLKALCKEKDLPISLVLRHMIKDWLQKRAELEKGRDGNV